MLALLSLKKTSTNLENEMTTLHEIRKDHCTPEEWALVSARRREQQGRADKPIPGAAELLSRPWGKVEFADESR